MLLSARQRRAHQGDPRYIWRAERRVVVAVRHPQRGTVEACPGGPPGYGAVFSNHRSVVMERYYRNQENEAAGRRRSHDLVGPDDRRPRRPAAFDGLADHQSGRSRSCRRYRDTAPSRPRLLRLGDELVHTAFEMPPASGDLRVDGRARQPADERSPPNLRCGSWVRPPRSFRTTSRRASELGMPGTGDWLRHPSTGVGDRERTGALALSDVPGIEDPVYLGASDSPR